MGGGQEPTTSSSPGIIFSGLRAFPHSLLPSLEEVTQASSDPSLGQRKPRVSAPDGQSHPKFHNCDDQEGKPSKVSSGDTGNSWGRAAVRHQEVVVVGGGPMTLVSCRIQDIWHPSPGPCALVKEPPTAPGTGPRYVWGEAAVRSKRSTGFPLRGKGLPGGLAERTLAHTHPGH